MPEPDFLKFSPRGVSDLRDDADMREETGCED